MVAAPATQLCDKGRILPFWVPLTLRLEVISHRHSLPPGVQPATMRYVLKLQEYLLYQPCESVMSRRASVSGVGEQDIATGPDSIDVDIRPRCVARVYGGLTVLGAVSCPLRETMFTAVYSTL